MFTTSFLKSKTNPSYLFCLIECKRSCCSSFVKSWRLFKCEVGDGERPSPDVYDRLRLQPDGTLRQRRHVPQGAWHEERRFVNVLFKVSKLEFKPSVEIHVHWKTETEYVDYCNRKFAAVLKRLCWFKFRQLHLLGKPLYRTEPFLRDWYDYHHDSKIRFH